MRRYAFRRAFFLLVGLLILTVPLFAGFRYADDGYCYVLLRASGCGYPDAGAGLLLREGLGFIVSVAVPLLALAVAIDLLSIVRERLRRRAE